MALAGGSLSKYSGSEVIRKEFKFGYKWHKRTVKDCIVLKKC